MLEFFFFLRSSSRIADLSSLRGSFARRQTVWTIMVDSKNLGRNVTKEKRRKIMDFFPSQILLFDVDKNKKMTWQSSVIPIS